MNESDAEIVLAFLDESRENLDQLDRDLVILERTPSDPQLLAQVFRTIHTIKGTCGFLGFHHLERLSHAGESLLGALRDGRLQLDAPITTSLLALVDAVRGALERIERTGAEGADDHKAVIAALDRHSAAPGDVDDSSVDVVADVASAPASVSELTAGSETTVRVEVTILDKLMDLVGELVLTRSQFGDSAATEDDGPLSLPYRQLRLVTSELQEGVMRARLQPVGTVTGRLPRVVRDLAAAMGKQIRIEAEGEEIGVDKAVNEALRDPLLHLVRNAVDHGIEPPDERRAAGKPATGTVSLRAFHEGGRVHIDLADDGRGVDPGRLVAKAIATGLITADEAAALRPEEALDLMFRAGLSTKEEITNISGRGVGMDVVRAALERVGGSIAVSSEPGIGSVFRLTVPLTLAIMPVLVASVGAQRFAVPQVDVQEVVLITTEEMATTVDVVEGALFYRLRDSLLPLVDLATMFRLEPVRHRSGVTVVVVESAGRRMGIVVDGIGETIEVVVKPLPRATRTIRLFGGVTILSDGEPALIVDVGGVAAAAGVTATRSVDAGRRPEVPAEEQDALLLATAVDGGRVAVRLAGVRRLEQIAGESVERAGPLEVIQYRGGILPLLHVGDVLAGGGVRAPAATILHAVVCESSIGLVGLVVGRIDDVVAQPSAPAQPPTRRGVIARVVVDDHVTELLDIETLIADAGLGQPA